MKKILRGILIIVIFAAIFMLYFRRLEIGDIWWHLKTGQIILLNKVVPTQDIFSYTSQGHKWLATQWLGAAVYYSIFKFFGVFGIQLFRALFFLVVLALLYYYLRRRLPFSTSIIFLLTAAFALLGRVEARPFIFNLLFIQIYFYILYAHHKDSFRKTVFILPLLQVIWQNLYAAGVYFSFALVGIFLTGIFFEFILLRLKGPASNDARKKKKAMSKECLNLLSIAVFSLLAIFIAPNSIKGVFYPLKIFLNSTQNSSFVSKNYIAEWQPFFASGAHFAVSNSLWYFVIASVALAVLIFNARKIEPVIVITFDFFLIIFLCANRNSDVFSLLSIIIIGQVMSELEAVEKAPSCHCEEGGARARSEAHPPRRGRSNLNFGIASGARRPRNDSGGVWQRSQLSKFHCKVFLAKKGFIKRAARILAGIFLFSFLLAGVYDYLTASVVMDGKKIKKFGIGVDYIGNPENALRFLDEHKIYGNIYNSYSIGGYIIWREFPKRKVFIDSRTDLYSDSVVFEKLFNLQNFKEWENLIREFNLNIVLLRVDVLDSSDVLFTKFLLRSKDWVCVYLDSTSVIFLKNGTFDKQFLSAVKINLFEGPNADLDLLKRYIIKVTPCDGNFIYRWLALRANKFPCPQGSIDKADWLCGIGAFDRAITAYAAALDTNPLRKDLYFWIGYCLYKLGRRADAGLFSAEALKFYPNDTNTLVLAGELVKSSDHEAALYFFRKAVSSNSANRNARELLASKADEDNLFREALNHYRWLSRKYPQDAGYRIHSGVLFAKLGKLNSSRKIFEQVVKFDPASKDGHFNLAVTYRKLGLIDLSRKELETVISLDPHNKQAKTYLLQLSP